jgi:hypothetical protein
VRSAENAPDPCRGLGGYVTTYQAVAAAPDLHLAEFRRRRYLLVVDEVHHLPALADADPSGLAPGQVGGDVEASWSKAILPLLELARVRLLLSGTLERADGRGILWLPYRQGPRTRTREVDLDAPGWAVVGYSRAAALAEKAVLPITFGALDGESRWLDEGRRPVGPAPAFRELRDHAAGAVHRAPHRVRRSAARRGPGGDAAAAGGAAGEARPRARRAGAGPRQAAGGGAGPGERPALPRARPRQAAGAGAGSGGADRGVGRGDAHEALAAFRLQPQPSVSVTVAMAYEGLDAPETAVVAALTHIRSRPWLEQMVARATRVDPFAGAWESSAPSSTTRTTCCSAASASGWKPSRAPSPATPRAPPAPPALPRRGRARGRAGHRAARLQRAGAALRDAGARPDFAARRPEAREAQADLLDPPSVLERRLRHRIGEMVAAQVVEDEEGLRLPRGGGNYHRLNAVLKRVLGKGRGEMGAAELDAAVAWLERNRLADHLHTLDGDGRYAFEARRRAGQWRPPQGRANSFDRAAESGRRGGGRPLPRGGKG